MVKNLKKANPSVVLAADSNLVISISFLTFSILDTTSLIIFSNFFPSLFYLHEIII